MDDDPNLDLLLWQRSGRRDEEAGSGFLGDMVAGFAGGLRSASFPAFMVDVLETETTAAGRAFIERVDLPFLPGGLPRVIAALGKGIWWAKQYQAYQAREADTSK